MIIIIVFMEIKAVFFLKVANRAKIKLNLKI